jgi:branched-chain amino acid transport system substrate-binding protein
MAIASIETIQKPSCQSEVLHGGGKTSINGRETMTYQAIRALARATVLAAAMAVANTASAQEIVLGSLLPLTGPAAPTGIEEQTGVIFAVDKINAAGGIRGRKITVIHEDSQGKPDVGVLSFNRLTDLRNVPVVITAFSSVSLAIAPLATRKKTLVINPAAQSNQLENASPYLLNTIPLVGDEAVVTAKFALNFMKKKTAAIIYENVAAGIDGKDYFKKAFEQMGGKVLIEEPVEFGQTNFRPTLLKVVASKPDVVYISMTQGHPAFAEQVGQLDSFPVALGTTFSRPFYGFKSTLGWYHTALKSDVTPAMEKEFNEKFKTKEMGFFAREYFNSTNIVLKAIEKVLADGGQITGESVRKAIFDIKTFKSDVATIVFNTNTAVRQIEMLQLAEGARKVVDFDSTK